MDGPSLNSGGGDLGRKWEAVVESNAFMSPTGSRGGGQGATCLVSGARRSPALQMIAF